MKNLVRIILVGMFVLPLISLALSCSEEDDCSAAARSMLYCNLYTLSDEGTAVRDTIDTLTVTAYATDSIIINAQEDVTDLSLPLRYTVDSTVLVFHYTTAETDTLVIRHSNTPYFLSMDCGYQMRQSVASISYSRHVLDSISISNAEANIYGTENLRLFY
ncbi:MAG: DUF6452 family protein [Bacteroides sp.]|nr:DUF6452 family protein [Bacteroides sp.]